MLITLLTLYQSLHLLNEYKGKLWPKIRKTWGVTQGVTQGGSHAAAASDYVAQWLPLVEASSILPELEPKPDVQSPGSQWTASTDMLRKTSSEATGVFEGLDMSTNTSCAIQQTEAPGAGVGNIHRTHPAPHLRKLWAHWLSAPGEGIGRKQQETQGQKRMRKSRKGQAEASAIVNKSRQLPLLDEMENAISVL